jgi:hypothetical protein
MIASMPRSRAIAADLRGIRKQVFADCPDRGTTAAVGGVPTFAEAMVNGEVAPIPAVRVEAMRHDRSELKPPAAGWRCWIALGPGHCSLRRYGDATQSEFNASKGTGRPRRWEPVLRPSNYLGANGSRTELPVRALLRRMAMAQSNPEISSRPALNSIVEPTKSSPTGSQRPPRWAARNASTTALKERRLSGRPRPWPSSR